MILWTGFFYTRYLSIREIEGEKGRVGEWERKRERQREGEREEEKEREDDTESRREG